MTYNFSELKRKTDDIQRWLNLEYQSLRTGRATPAILDNILVEAYGSRVPLKQVAAIGMENAQTIRITPWDKGQVKSLETAIAASNLGLSAVVDQNGLRVVFPPLTSERRILLVKLVKEKLEESRIHLRAERDKVWQEIQRLEKEKKMGEDDKFRAKNELQKIIDESGEKLSELAAKKESEIMA